jgi:2-polyprenyl-3-methyl-5-hydroxy-6-metoxy-1,4-benzoquinol methylase
MESRKSIDEDVLAAYNAGIEKNRLRSGLGQIEFARTKELLCEYLPAAPAVIYDIGGGYGEYSWYLASLGYKVHLFDIAETNIRMAEALSSEYPNTTLEATEVSDARSINRPDSSADAVLLMGPLYHITEYEERIAALKECRRLLKPNGRLFSAAITRYATTLWAVTFYGVENELLNEPEFLQMITHEIATGQHIRPAASRYRGMGRSYFHLPKELESELYAAGFRNADVRGVIGCGWLAPHLDELWEDEKRREAVLNIVRLLEKEESIMGLSTHLLAIAEK